ncbi:MAG: dependent oxidoreductase [Nocardioides sp.]|nr:dependent oxidoreductase [Nocardioides sp.]
MCPWWEDHVTVDESLHRRWAGERPDPDAFISSDLVSEAVLEHPELMAEVGGYFAMLAPPGSLHGAREKVRELIRQGWTPRFPEGPSRDEFVAAMSTAT